MLYVGQTTKNAIQRFQEHIQCAKRLLQSQDLNFRKDKKQQLLYTRMCETGINNWRIIPIESLIPSIENRETFWINKLQTLQPNGLNYILPNSFTCELQDNFM